MSSLREIFDRKFIIQVSLVSLLSLVVAFSVMWYLFHEYHTVVRRIQKMPVDSTQIITFAGDVVPAYKKKIKKKINSERKKYLNPKIRAEFLLIKANYWFPKIEYVFQKKGVHPDLKYLAVVESELTTKVKGGGAVGMWQLMRPTAKAMGLRVDAEVDERYNAVKSTIAAARYFKLSHDQLGNWTNVAASYNTGIRGLFRKLKVQHKQSYYHLKLSKIPAKYVYKAIAFKQIYQNPQKYNLKPRKNIAFYEHRVMVVKVNRSIKNLSQWAHIHNTTLGYIKHLNPWIRSNRLTVPKGASYLIIVPDYPKKQVEIFPKPALSMGKNG